MRLGGGRQQKRSGTSGKNWETLAALCVINSWVLFHQACALTCRQKEKEQMEALRKHHAEEIDHHKKEIERLQKEINRHQGKIRKLKHDD